ncbi:hypothetical protein QBC32DRAFT_334067 [Pseudoneurospora amorphoporcata]|uniref:Uncharacterized protein n=1 Tax=Pseudoneurospora amorphoporcata TaxID=241081 RepID=A0AAN6P298_9PEZI|nr:hypothetical protein QBC32DRAFT_334067 [Pseudoneurospora amorphoporcata]
MSSNANYEPDANPGSVSASPNMGDAGSIAGAAGTSTNNVGLSQGGLIAIIVVVCVVTIFGVGSAVLFFMAKKHEWKVRETIRRSAKRVVTALTPRRSEFPRSVKGSFRSTRSQNKGRVRIDDVPPTPRIKPEHLDLEKGLEKPEKSGKTRINFSRK